ncbi:hypothetical protein [Cacatuid alphaherpesvirus 2]|uniref:Nuclear egress protein 2 n=1 Tax=Cacatuid alphaherpesvirus 2 TaxID=2604840 RepID=A0A5B9RBF8_9ALPH|nr:hypothetical protein QKT46_gp32 [Cacatuid alphaherpesvirus 2]QEG54095.1 hypothetical protein [Cacatuid alphaherpesvirus 2]
MKPDKYSQLVNAVNASLSMCGTTATLVYTRNNARLAPTGDIITFPARLDGPPIPAEFILEALTSLLTIRTAWLRIQNTGQAVIVAGCSTQNFHHGDMTWEPPTSTVALTTAKSLWVSASAVRDMKNAQRIRTAPLAAMMFICFYRGGKNEVTARFAFYKSDSEPNVLKISKCVYEVMDTLEARRLSRHKIDSPMLIERTFRENRDTIASSNVSANVKDAQLRIKKSFASKIYDNIGAAVKCVRKNMGWILIAGAWTFAIAVVVAYIK